VPFAAFTVSQQTGLLRSQQTGKIAVLKLKGCLCLSDFCWLYLVAFSFLANQRLHSRKSLHIMISLLKTQGLPDLLATDRPTCLKNHFAKYLQQLLFVCYDQFMFFLSSSLLVCLLFTEILWYLTGNGHGLGHF